jgi:hypothetical protein
MSAYSHIKDKDTQKCKFCGDFLKKEFIKRHEEICDDNPKSKSYKELKGLGGWLVLIQINLWASIILYATGIINSIILDSSIIVFYILLLGLTGYTFFLMYSKNKKFLKFAIINLWVQLFIPLINTFGLTINAGTPQEAGTIFGSLFPLILYSIIWTNYLLKSKRVKNTFVK